MNLGTQLHELVNHVEQVRDNKIPWQAAKFRMMAIDFAEKYQGFELDGFRYDLKSLMESTCVALHTTVEEMRGPSRNRKIVEARRFYSNYALKHVREGSWTAALASIGKSLDRHHATIIHGRTQHQNLMATDENYANRYLNYAIVLSTTIKS